MENKTKQWGGKREGAGRKPKAFKAPTLTIRITDEELSAVLDKVGKKNPWVLAAIREKAQRDGLIVAIDK
jgi:hypothetical protein